MRLAIFRLWGLVLLLGPCWGIQAQEQSVVLINTEKGSGYGVAYGGPNLIVTALHVVSGRQDIQVKWQGRTAHAVIEKIYKPADLALLRIDQNWNLPQLSLYQRPGVPSGIQLNYWELPPRATRMDRKVTTLSHATPLGRLNPRLSGNQAEFAKALCVDGSGGYPALNTTVIKFGERNVDKAHSGSPITYNDQIVGMINGGDKPTNGTPSLWAIPASAFNDLLARGTPVNPQQLAPCSSAKLYSGLRSDNPLLDPYQQQVAQQIEASRNNPVTADNGQLVYTLEMVATYNDFYSTLFEEDMNSIQGMFYDIESSFPPEEQLNAGYLGNVGLTLYREHNTGATIALPASSQPVVTEERGLTILEISSDYEGITMYVYLARTNSVAEAKEALNGFKRYMTSDGLNWVPEETEVDDYLDDEYDPYYHETAELTAYVSDQDGDIIYDEYDDPMIEAEFFASLTVDGTNFLGVAVQINDFETVILDQEERAYMYLFEICALMTDFSYY